MVNFCVKFDICCGLLIDSADVTDSLLYGYVNADESEVEDASSPIPLDDGLPIDFGAIDSVQCLIEHHNAIFTDANETVWR